MNEQEDWFHLLSYKVGKEKDESQKEKEQVPAKTPNSSQIELTGKGGSVLTSTR